MEEMNIRFKELRKACKKNQTEFGSVLGISPSGVADIESGRRNVTEKHLIMLSNWEEYNVNINWLRTGEGKMFLETETNMLEKIKEEYRLSDRQFRFVASFLRLPEDERDVIMKWLESVFSDADTEQKRIDAEVEEYRRQLEAESMAKGKSGVISVTSAKEA